MTDAPWDWPPEAREAVARALCGPEEPGKTVRRFVGDTPTEMTLLEAYMEDADAALTALAPFVAARVAAAEEAAAREMQEACEDPAGEYHTGICCGIEDRSITDRYEAAIYGWQQAFEYMQSALPLPNGALAAAERAAKVAGMREAAPFMQAMAGMLAWVEQHPVKHPYDAYRAALNAHDEWTAILALAEKEG